MEQVWAAVLLGLFTCNLPLKTGPHFKEHEQAARSQRQYTESQILENL